MSTRAYRVGLFGEEGVGKSTFFDTAAQAPPRRENGVRKVRPPAALPRTTGR